MHRRRLLSACATGTLTALLAGCTGDDPADASPTDGSPTGTPTRDPGDELGSPTTAPPTEDRPGTRPDEGLGRLADPGFEDDLSGWVVGRDLPDRLAPGGADVAVTDRRAAAGERALALTLDGSHDDGTVWVQQHVDLSGVEELAVEVYSPDPSFNEVLQVAAYTGPDRDLTERDFDRSEQVRAHEGWRTCTYDVVHDGPGLVAVGLNIVWETTATGLLDAVRLRA